MKGLVLFFAIAIAAALIYYFGFYKKNKERQIGKSEPVNMTDEPPLHDEKKEAKGPNDPDFNGGQLIDGEIRPPDPQHTDLLPVSGLMTSPAGTSLAKKKITETRSSVVGGVKPPKQPVKPNQSINSPATAQPAGTKVGKKVDKFVKNQKTKF